MRCQRIGRYPTGTIGFGIDSEYSRSLIPRPPQKITTFIRSPSLCSDRRQSRRRGPRRGRTGARPRQKVLEPGLATESAVLLPAPPVPPSARGGLDVLVAEGLGLGDPAPPGAAEHQTLPHVK